MMNRSRRSLGAVLCLTVCAVAARLAAGPPVVSGAARDEAQRANNLGVAWLEQYRYDDAVRAFGQALTHDPNLTLARLNLAIALANVPDMEGAEREARAALREAPEALQGHYVLGLAARGQGHADEAQAAFRKVLERDPRDVGARVNLGQLMMQERRYDEAAAEFRAAAEAEPTSGTALYNLSLALNRAGQREAAQEPLKRFEALRDSGAAKLIGTNYPEQGHYAEALQATGVEAGAVALGLPAAHFVEAREALPESARPLVAGARAGVALFDFDADGALDVLDVRPDGLRLLRATGARFEDVSAAVGLAAARGGQGALAGDCNGDGALDLVVLREEGLTLFTQAGGRFTDATATAGLGAPAAPARFTTAALADVDHDGDLDLFVAGVDAVTASAPAPPRLYRNDGACVFTDAAEIAGLRAAPLAAVAVAPTDYDNGRDVDLFVLGRDAPPRLYHNRRDLTFRDVAAEQGLTRAARYASLAAGDFDKDGFVDLFWGVADGPDALARARRDARGQWRVEDAPAGSSRSAAAAFVDYDGDGLLDLLTLGPLGLRVLRNLGERFVDVSDTALAGLAPAARGVGPAGPRTLASGDLDGDGAPDLVIRASDGSLRLLRNTGGPERATVVVRLDGLVSNRAGVGVKVELRAAGLWQKLETASATPAVTPADVLFGLGTRGHADAVRVLWPSGILQTEILGPSGAARRTLAVKELDRKPSSCPFLYAWDGQRFAFVTDFMGGGEMGYLVAPGVFNTPDPVEHVRLSGDQLRARDGRYDLRVTNELEEVLFVDRLALVAVTHPSDVQVFPNEGMTAPPKPERLWGARDLRPPLAAHDHAGRDVRARLTSVDRAFVDDLPRLRVRGYARPHTLTLDLGALGPRPLLLLTGFTDYAFSSDNRAASQAGIELHPPALQVRDERGAWRTVVEQIGIPVGRPQTVAVDLHDVWLGPSREVRLVTSMRVYWDQALVGEVVDDALQTTPLPLSSAVLRARGFSAEVSPDGREPFGYDYERVTRSSPWKVFPGRYTGTGDVRELLQASDDAFVIAQPGDELALSFPALDEPPPGFARTFLFVADGYSKEMDVNSALPHAVDPLPFHGMTSYPYGARERFPWTPALRELMERTRTRVVRRPFVPLTAEP